MGWLRTYLLLLFICVSTLACAGGPQAIPIKDPTQRIQFEGFSILPPQGENWKIMSPPPPEFRFAFVKDYPRHKIEQPTIGAMIFFVRIDELPPEQRPLLLQGIRKKMEHEMNSGRFRPVTFKAEQIKFSGADCVTYDGRTEQHGSVRFPEIVFLMTMRGIACIHPQSPIVIKLDYSQRAVQGEQLMDVEAEGETFLKSLVFNSLDKQGP